MNGHVSVVGLGPGRPDWRTPEVTQRLHAATDIIGYAPYLRMLPSSVRARRHPSGNRVEAQRAAHALDLAAAGRHVVVISSGDPGVFGMASAVVEQLDIHPGRWDGVDVEVVPGISAAHALASRVGAPLGHDFCVVSLSDVLKPWDVIVERLHAAARADFVIVLYNPRSRHRPHQLADALAIIGEHQAADTAVVAGRDVGRAAEKITVTTLGRLDPDTVDMRTVLIVGSSSTRVVPYGPPGASVYTPRRYIRAHDPIRQT
jgi:precorrin-2 C20-methyltransferase/precorrin-3B C17-methyltransferase